MSALAQHHTTYIKGFTLLEMVVVMSIFGLITAIAFPKLDNMYQSVQNATHKDDIKSQLKLLSFKAYQNGQAFTLKQATLNTDLMNMPSDWLLEENNTPITYSAIGVCSGGQASFYSKKGRISFQLSPPLCSPVTNTASPL